MNILNILQNILRTPTLKALHVHISYTFFLAGYPSNLAYLSIIRKKVMIKNTFKPQGEQAHAFTSWWFYLCSLSISPHRHSHPVSLMQATWLPYDATEKKKIDTKFFFLFKKKSPHHWEITWCHRQPSVCGIGYAEVGCSSTQLSCLAYTRTIRWSSVA